MKQERYEELMIDYLTVDEEIEFAESKKLPKKIITILKSRKKEIACELLLSSLLQSS